MQSLDYPIFRWINEGPQAFEPTMLFFSQAVNYGWVKAILLIMIIAMIWRGANYRRAILFALLGVAIANPITDLAKHFFHSARPFKDPAIANDVVLRIGSINDQVGFGTASAHSANMAAVAVAMWMNLGWSWGVPWTIIALLTGYSRVYNGVHFPSQVCLGWFIGAITTFAMVSVYRLSSERRHQPVEPGAGPVGSSA